MNEIFPGLFVGDLESVNKDSISRHEITHIVSICEDMLLKGLDWKELGIPTSHRLHFDVQDRAQVLIFPLFDPVTRWIDKVLQNSEHKVLVHCHAGRSRSVALVAAFLIRFWSRITHGYDPSLDTILALIKQKRPTINPNAGFRRQLKQYEVRQRKRRQQAAALSVKKERQRFLRDTIEHYLPSPRQICSGIVLSYIGKREKGSDEGPVKDSDVPALDTEQ